MPKLMQLLAKVPVWLKSIIIGFLILEFGTKLWSITAVSNIRLSPNIPWAFPVMLIFLFLIWKYLNGSWKPKSTQERRRLWIRSNQLAENKIKWGWSAAILLGFTIILLMLISTRLTDTPSGQIAQIERISVYPLVTVVSLLIMTSLVAGIIEEIAFRGYMQKPMELKYGPKAAIIIVALFFTLLHLPNATITPHLMPIFFCGSIGWGVLAYLNNSIIPGIIVHCAIDLVGYFWAWQNLDLAKAMASESVWNDGMDSSFILLLILAITTISALIFSFYKLSRIKPLAV